jgi:Ca2+-binding RTX toxin-like protein
VATNLQFGLSSKLLGNLTKGGKGNGVFAYAFAFEGANLIKGGAVTLVDNGVAKGSPTIPLTSATDLTFKSGKVYVVIQQTGAGGTSDLLKTITQVGDINPIDSQKRNYRFDLVEATLSKSGADVADISSIDQFGSTMTLGVTYKSGTDTRGYAVSGSKIDAAITAASPKGVQNQIFQAPNPAYPGIKPGANAPLNELRDAVMPGNNFTPNPIPGTDWTKYVNAFKSWASKIEIVTTFNGSPVQPQAMLADYTVQYDKGTDSFWLVPDKSQGGTATDYINIKTKDLIDNIYLQTGKLTVYAGSKTGTKKVWDSFTPNTASGAVAKYFVAGFDAGFWGATGQSINPKDKSTLSLDQTWNWNANYAYNAILDPKVGYKNALGTGPGTPTGQNRFFDPYAGEIFKDSNAYGYSYTDLISGGGGINPAISLWDPATKANVQTVKISLFDLGETPSSGYKTGNTGYLAPTSTDYKPATTATNANNQFLFTFGFQIPGGKFMAPSDQTPISFRFYAPGDRQAGSDGFVTLQLAQKNWFYYQITGRAGKWALNPTNPGGQGGFFAIKNVPVTADGSPAWYQLSYGTTGAHSTYNFYATATNGTLSTVVADHGVEVNTNTPAGNFGFSFAPGGAMTYDPATFNAPKGLARNNIVGGNGNDTLDGDDGGNKLFGGAGNDTLNGDGGSDRLNGGPGADTMAGGTGNDVYRVDNVGDRTIEAVGEGTDTVLARIGYTLGAGQAVERLRADAGMTGLTLGGNAFNNNIQGGDGNDTLTGGDGIDKLGGGGGDDTLSGGNGNDKLTGGIGNDKLTGGIGNDIFLFDSAFIGVANVDTVADFDTAHDRIELDHAYIAGLPLGALSASAFALDSATGTAAQIVYDTSRGSLFYDSNGADPGGATRFATLKGAPALSESNFFVV